MQGQRSTVQFFPEAIDFDHASSSSGSALDQQVYWNNVLNPGDARNAPDYFLSRIEANMPYRRMLSHETESLSGWNMGGSSSSELMMNPDNLDRSDMENVWASSSAGYSGAGPRFEERRLDTANMFSLDSAVLNLNSNQIAQGQFFLRNSTSSGFLDNVDCNAQVTCDCGHVPQTGICPFHNPFASEVELPSAIGSHSHGISTGDGVDYLDEDADDRPGSLLDGRRLSGKRKNVEGAPSPSSGSSSNICFQQTENSLLPNVPPRNISSSSSTMFLNNLSSVRPPEEHLNPRIIAGIRGAVSESLSSISVAGSAEGSQRNFRLRINPSQQTDSSVPNLWSLGNSSMNHSVWSPHQSSSLLIPVNQPLETRPAMPSTSNQSQSHLPGVPGLPRMMHPFLWNGTSISGSSSNSHMISHERLAALREEANLRRNSILEHPMFVPVTELRRVAQDHANWNLVNGNVRNIPGNLDSMSLVGSTSGIQPSMPPTWTPHQNPHNQYQQTSSEFVYRTFPAISDPGGHLNNFLPQRPAHPTSSELSPPTGAGLRTHQQPSLRSAFLMGRRSNVMGAPLTLRTLAAAREGRNMMIYEHIRNALDRMRRSESMRFEDVLILDQSAIFEAADLHDRHRDMRLDIDNMSYEELLALEERIGNVSTGLNEETILKHLKQRKYLSISLMLSGQAEPCCICQEEYLDGEDLGTLDCGHDFHTVCVRQWLMQKNVCPICKMTALATS